MIYTKESLALVREAINKLRLAVESKKLKTHVVLEGRVSTMNNSADI